MEHWVLKIIRIKRLEKNYSQEYISSKINISQSNYTRIENGKTALKIEILQKILAVLEIDFFDFFEIVKEYKSNDKVS